MKLKCIKKNHNFTVNKYYNVVEYKYNEYYIIIDDNGEKHYISIDFAIDNFMEV